MMIAGRASDQRTVVGQSLSRFLNGLGLASDEAGGRDLVLK